MTNMLEIVDLGEAKAETRQMPTLPWFIDNISAYGIFPL